MSIKKEALNVLATEILFLNLVIFLFLSISDHTCISSFKSGDHQGATLVQRLQT